jgi:aspartyl-tRNA(Asn)/glutamyl-tRNA(Gln) amidotransferase subunit A
MANSVSDTSLVLAVISGADPRDPTSMDSEPFDNPTSTHEAIKGLRVGIPKEYLGEGLDDSIRQGVSRTADRLRNLGADVLDVSLPMTEYGIAAYYVLVTAEASSNLARYDGIRYGYRAEARSLVEMYERSRSEGFGDEVKRRIMLGTYVLSAGYYEAYYERAQRVRRLIQEDFERVFSDVDVLLTPTTPTTAFKLREKIDDPLQMYLNDVYTVTANLAGIPAISVTIQTDSTDLPMGAQVLAPAFSENLLFKVAAAVENSMSD